MTITEEQGEKRAACPKCGQVVLIPDAASGIRSRRRSRAGDLTQTSALVPVPPAHAAETDSGAEPPVHQLPTRVEADPGLIGSLTALMGPPQGPGEIGRLGGYRVLAVVGAGGMGVVFRAEDPVLQRVVALKAMLPSLAASATARQRFLREARAAASLQHDHIVTIYQVGEDRGVPFLAMPFLEGEPLDRRLARLGVPLPVPEVLRIAREIALGLAAIHQRGLIHRDVKPANVWLEAESDRVKILDFGLARAAQGEIQLTQEGAIVGSPAFMAPEQAGRHAVDARADLFSLGCVMYIMSTARLPFEGPDALATLLAVTTAQPPAPEAVNRAVPAAVADLVMKLLAKNPDDRPESARAVVERIKALERAPRRGVRRPGERRG
jgi:serine/threonine protein kinase